jgi:hypothetical protein
MQTSKPETREARQRRKELLERGIFNKADVDVARRSAPETVTKGHRAPKYPTLDQLDEENN